MSSTPVRAPDPESGDPAILGEAVRIVGRIITNEDLRIEGDVRGSIDARRNQIIVGKNGRVQATVRARDIIVLGQMRGDIEVTDHVQLGSEGLLTGSVKAARILIEEGAQFTGDVDIAANNGAQLP